MRETLGLMVGAMVGPPVVVVMDLTEVGTEAEVAEDLDLGLGWVEILSMENIQRWVVEDLGWVRYS